MLSLQSSSLECFWYCHTGLKIMTIITLVRVFVCLKREAYKY